MKVCQEGKRLFQLIKASHPGFLARSRSIKKKKTKKNTLNVPVGFKKPEVAEGLPHHDQNHIPSSSTSSVSGGHLSHAARGSSDLDPQFRTRDGEEKLAVILYVNSLHSMAGQWLFCKPLFSSASHKNAKRHPGSSCWRKVDGFSLELEKKRKKKKRLRGRWAVLSPPTCLPASANQPASHPRNHSSTSLPFLPSLSLSHTAFLPLSVTACLLFHPSIKQ